ncbi:hypothetical protein DBR43_26665 [Pedobacter sp. KBW06]|uniref:hypothetical protein n=1 Tax=Pedobacter sp. KBW06 TaxID=2153359 RepID=UPI000F5B2C3E|nr:hypothetical protein [Pedobacter sp. KBW06]RQO65834.1 hypothetical protein DBR43_26665 [Pedobacter sp. KBW06]
MKAAVFLLLLLFATKTYSAEPELREVKRLFEAATHSKDSSDRLLEILSGIGPSSPPLFICYKGAAEMMRCRYGLNPIHKFKRFKKGKALIEAAVKKESHNIEIRFLRFAIQTNLPSFLNYNDDITKDKQFLLSNLKTIKDKKLKDSISKYLSTSNYCSAEEKKGLNT